MKKQRNIKFKKIPEIDEMFDDLEKEERERLRADIEKNGITNPIILSEQYEIICGYQRYKIAKKLGIPDFKIPHKIIHFKNYEEKLLRALKDNMLRRQLNNFSKGQAALRFLSLYEKQAKKRQNRGIKTNREEKGRTLEKLGEIAGLSHGTMHKIRYILDHGTKIDIKKANRNEISVSALYEKIKLDHKMDEANIKDKSVRKQIHNLKLSKKKMEHLIHSAEHHPQKVEKILNDQNRKNNHLSKYFDEYFITQTPGAIFASKEEMNRVVNIDDVIKRHLKPIKASPVENMNKTILLTYKPKIYDEVTEILKTIDKDQNKAVLKLCRQHKNT